MDKTTQDLSKRLVEKITARLSEQDDRVPVHINALKNIAHKSIQQGNWEEFDLRLCLLLRIAEKSGWNRGLLRGSRQQAEPHNPLDNQADGHKV